MVLLAILVRSLTNLQMTVFDFSWFFLETKHKDSINDLTIWL